MGYFIVYIVGAFIWGFATKSIIENKGYDENWFWWGFFFGFIAFIVALTKPECISHNTINDNNMHSLLSYRDEIRKKDMINTGGWNCYCGKTNPVYTGTCACGRTKEWNAERDRIKAEEEKNKKKMEEEGQKLDNLKKLKELYDIGAISEEEYEEKKKEYL